MSDNTCTGRPHGPHRSHRRRAATGLSAPAAVDLPRGSPEPLLHLEFAPGATTAEVERAIRYWTPGSAGGWAEPAAALGAPTRVAADLLSVCRVHLVRHRCGTCSAPTRVASRSDAVALAGHDLLRRPGTPPTCPDCRRAPGDPGTGGLGADDPGTGGPGPPANRP
ncbi:hypothetical protein [Nocardiopsis protaetiae]|uniref:hypothetical protein n=1 Tax=Nocardiopsis protaetiae TaxID=3382270 RepID=UPI00387B2E77